MTILICDPLWSVTSDQNFGVPNNGICFLRTSTQPQCNRKLIVYKIYKNTRKFFHIKLHEESEKNPLNTV